MVSLRSEIAVRLLNYFFMNPHEKVYGNELARKLALDKRNLIKKLREFEKEGIFLSENRGNMKLYSINKKYPLYNEYRQIILKTVGFENSLKRILTAIKGAERAYIYGSYAKGKTEAHSDIDVLVVGSHDIAALQKKIAELQKEIEREINIVNMDRSEFEKRIKRKDPFIGGMLKGKNIRLI